MRKIRLAFVLGFAILLIQSCYYEDLQPDLYDPGLPIKPNMTEGWELVTSEWPNGKLTISEDGGRISCIRDKQVFHSTDSCKTWKRVDPPEFQLLQVVDFDSMYFVKHDRGEGDYIYGDCSIYRTIDGGKTFELMKVFHRAGLFNATSDSVYMMISHENELLQIFDTSYSFDLSFQNQTITEKPHPSLVQKEKSNYTPIGGNYDYRKDGTTITIRHYESQIPRDSLILDFDRVQGDLRNVHFFDNHLIYYAQDTNIFSYDFETKTKSLVMESYYPVSWYFLRKVNDNPGFITGYWAAQFYGLMYQDRDTSYDYFYYNWQLKGEFEHIGKKDIVKLEYLFDKSYLYMFVGDGRIWRRKM